jgi:hypothetical protein
VVFGVVAAETFTKDSSGRLVAIDLDLTASAVDPDGDDLEYTWSSPDCPHPVSGFSSAAAPAMAATLTAGPGSTTTDTVHFHGGDPSRNCTIRVDVTDYWPNGIVPVGSGLPAARGGRTVAIVGATSALDSTVAPEITQIYQSNATNTINPGQTVVIGVGTVDPTPGFEVPQTPFTFRWSQSGGAFVSGSEVDVATSPGRSTIEWTAPSPLAQGMTATVLITNAAGLTTSHIWTFSPGP